MLLIGSRLIGSRGVEFHYLGGLRMADINKQVGINIRKHRVKRGWTQEQLAFEAGLHRAYIGHVERGEKNIGLVNLEKIAKALDIKIGKLIK